MDEQQGEPAEGATRLLWQLKPKHLQDDEIRTALRQLLLEFRNVCTQLGFAVDASEDHVEVIVGGRRGAFVRLLEFDGPKVTLSSFSYIAGTRASDKGEAPLLELAYDPVSRRIVSRTNDSDPVRPSREQRKQPRDGLSELAEVVGRAILQDKWRVLPEVGYVR